MSTPDNPDAWSDPTAPSPNGAYDSPTYDATSDGSPTYGAPTYGSPTYGSPTYDSPAYDSPTYGSPTYDSPTYDSPTYGAPGSYPPPSHGYPPPDPTVAGWAAPATAYPTSPPGPPPGPRRGARGPVVALVLGLVVVVAAAAVGIGYLLLRGDDHPRPSVAVSTGRSTPPAAPSGATTGPPGASDSPSPTDTSDDTAQVEVPAVTPGYQGVLSQKENVAYDVPEGWKVETPGTLVGYEDNDGQPTAIIHGVSTYLPDACPDVSGSNRGNAGFETAGSVDPAQAAQGGVTTFAQGAALNEDGTSSPVTTGSVTDVALAGGTITAKMATATVTPSESGDCVAPSIAFTAVAFTTPTGATALFILYLDQGTSDALPAASAQQIVASLRPYTG